MKDLIIESMRAMIALSIDFIAYIKSSIRQKQIILLIDHLLAQRWLPELMQLNRWRLMIIAISFK